MVSDIASTLGALLNWGKERLKSAGVEDYDISAEILLREILGLSRAELFAGIRSGADSRQYALYKEHIAKRESRVPLQYITGSTEFYNVTIKCDPRALIPRPETEILVETVLERLKKVGTPRVLDIGTGSGNIAIAIAANLDQAEILGIDISGEALDLARSNAELNNVDSRCEITAGDINDERFVGQLGRFECVVSNPPYVSREQAGTLQPEVVEFEPKIALFSETGPLHFFKLITGMSSRLLRPGGLLAFEVGMGQAGDVKRLMERSHLANVSTVEDLNGTERVVIGMLRSAGD